MKSIEHHLKNKCIVEVNTNSLSVAVQKSGEKRLIWGLTEVNKHVSKNKVKFDVFKNALCR